MEIIDRIEPLILQNLTSNEDFARKVLPFLNPLYFGNKSERIVFETIDKYIKQYNSLPTPEALMIEVSDGGGSTENEHKQVLSVLNDIGLNRDVQPPDQKWLVDRVENFCKDRAMDIAVMDAVGILNGTDKKRDRGTIPKLLQDALAVSFDSNIGHDYLEDAEKRYEFYRKLEKRIPFDLEFFNRITRGGLPSKTLNSVMAGTDVGKSLCMCHLASSYLAQGKNVLYITLEMAAERIAERIDANLLNIPLNELSGTSKEVFGQRIKGLRQRTQGRLIIKEYPTATAHSGHFRHLINELNLKKNFKPDVVFVDYINICASSRVSHGPNVNSYTFVKAIAEELRGLAVEFDVPLISATQTTRSGMSNTDIGLEDTSESIGLPQSADLFLALIVTEELQKLNQILVKVLKNRYMDLTQNRKFVIGVDRSKMRLYDVEQTAQEELIDSGQTPQTPTKPTGPTSAFKRSRTSKFALKV